MTEQIEIPATLAQAGSRLTGIDKVVMAKEWERAAIVYAFTQPRVGQGPQRNFSKSGEVLSPEAFARKGYPGLRSHTTVLEYRNRWQAMIDDGHAVAVKPGQTITLPSVKWPGSPRNIGIAHEIGSGNPPDVRARAVAKAMADPEVAREVAKDDATVEAVYQAQIQVNRTREPLGSGLAEEHAKRAGATAARNMGRAVGEEDDAMVMMHLRRAAHELAEAMYMRETFKVTVNPDREREALEAIDRMLSAYRVNDPMAELSDTDRSILSDLGLVNP